MSNSANDKEPKLTFDALADFMEHLMHMAHVHQPLLFRRD